MGAARWHDHLTVIYTSPQSSTCILEKLVHLQPEEIHHDLMITVLEAPDNLSMAELPVRELPPNWRAYPAPPILQRIGNAWLREKSSALLFVPSVIDPMASNVLINPLHHEVVRITITEVQPFRYDERLR